MAGSALMATSAAPSATSSPTVAREDTMSTEVNPVLVRAPRVTLDEILDRVARGEAHRDSLIRDESFRVTLRIVRQPGGDKPPVLVQETVDHVYRKRGGRVRVVTLRERREHPEKGKKASVQFGDDFDESIVNFAFQPSSRRDFRYSIAGRDLVGNHLVYRIAFRPRSELDPEMPSGVVWIDTNDFVIVRQEVSFDRSPMPLFFRGIDRMVIERRRAGDLWVLSRVLLRAEMSFTIPRFGKAFDLAMLYDDYVINGGLPDSLFVSRPRAAAGTEP
jgi:hypothetical protein